MNPERTAVLIRDAEVADVARVIDIDARITGIAKPDLWYGKYSSAKYLAHARPFLVAHDAERIVGYVLGEVREWEFGAPPSGWLYAIGVDPDVRQEGLGAKLFEALRTRFRQLGIRKMRTILHVEDDLLMSFFRSQGMMAGPFIELEMLTSAPPPADPTPA